jgi:hypothetical protein
MSLSGMAEIPRLQAKVKFRHASEGRHPGLAVGGKAQTWIPAFAGKTEKEQSRLQVAANFLSRRLPARIRL